MRNTRRLASVPLATALFATGLLASSLPAAAAAPGPDAATGTLRLAGWFDTDSDGKRDDGEPALTDYTGFIVRSLDGGLAPVLPGPGMTELNVPAGDYEVSTLDYRSTIGTPRVSVPAGGTGTAELGLRGRTVRGNVWTDRNIDGVRQPDEPGRADVRITARNTETTSRGDGQYTLDNVAFAAALSAPELRRGGSLLPAPPRQSSGTPDQQDTDDSDFLESGSTNVLVGSSDVEHVDLGVAPGSFDQKVELSTDRDTEALRVGDEVVATVTMRGWAGLPAQRWAEMSVPAGTEFVGADGDGWPVEPAGDGKLVTIRPTKPQPIGTFHQVRVRLRVAEKPAGDGELAVRLNGRDADASNDEASQPVRIT